MDIKDNEELDYLLPIKIADGIYWVGYSDQNARLHCNPYIIVEDDEAVLIDGGSRDDFSTVMLKILRLGINPKTINRLIYQHFDPDLCGNLPHLEAIIENPDLKIISHRDNNVFINYYSSMTPKLCIEKIGYTYTFKSGRKLEFYRTPYAHAPGSFITYDLKTRTLFSSDIFGSYDANWSLYSNVPEECFKCKPDKYCKIDDKLCPIHGILDFHRRNMNSKDSLRYALEQIEKLDPILVAPQHGSIINSKKDLNLIISRLKEEENIGFDYFLQENNHGYR
ncbi:MAG: MBL fold metallo-hydrolase [Tissierellaceae bacterium]|nr:MBL fold metallo-hydrolase [Tissierellaceae bacterium]